MANVKRNKVKTYLSASDAATYRVMVLLMVCFGAMMALSSLGRTIGDIGTSESSRIVIYMLVISIPALLFAGGLFYLLKNLKNKDASKRVLSPRFVFAVTLVLFFAGILIRVINHQSRANAILYVVFPVLTVLFVVYCTFQRECFTLACSMGANAFILFLLYKLADYISFSALLPFLTAGLILLNAGYAAAVVLAARRSGTLRFKGKKVRLLSSKAAFWPHITFSVLASAAFVCVCVIGRLAAYYGLLALAGSAVLAGVYYVILLMGQNNGK